MPPSSFRVQIRLLALALTVLTVTVQATGFRVAQNPNQIDTSSPATDTVRIWLNGDIIGAQPGWNNSSPGPTITVISGETVQLFLNATDTQLHNWFVDSNNNYTPDPNGISSPDFSLATTKVLNFTFTPMIGKNIPSAGNWTYRCKYHPFPYMYGTIRIEQAQVQDFQISANPATMTVLAGQTGNSTITLTPINGFAGTVALSTFPSSPSIECSLNSTSIIVGSSRPATLSCKGQAGTYHVMIAAQSGTTIRTATVAYAIQDFLLTTNDQILTPDANSKIISAVAIAPLYGFAGTTSLNVESPAGINATLSPSSIPNGSGFSTITILTTLAGNYSLTIIATSGPLAHSLGLTIQVGDFKIVSSTESASATSGQPVSSQVRVSPINSFRGTVYLTTDSAYCEINPVQTTAPANATLTCNFPIPTTYHVNVTATSRGLSHTLTMTYVATSISQAPTNNPPDLLPLATIVFAAMAACVIVLLFLRRRRTGSNSLGA